MGLLGQESLTVTRTDGEYNDAGDWIQNDPTTFPFTGTVLPITGDDLLELDEGQRKSASYTLHSMDGDLRVADPATQAMSDQIERNGVLLLVTNREDLSHVRMALAHYKYILSKPGLTS